MKQLTRLLLAAFCLFCLPALAGDKKDKDEKRDDSRYLAGAVPQTADGKIVFSKELNIPSMSQDQIYDIIASWMDARLKKNENNSRVVYSNKQEHLIAGVGEEWMVFSSTALSLDRALIQYQLSAICLPEKCILEVEKIKFVYREGKEKYTAEEWISDKYALNKEKTKLVKGLAKWRRKTVDFVDALCNEAAAAPLSSFSPRITVSEVNRQNDVKADVRPVTSPGRPSQPARPAAKYREVAPSSLPADAIQTSAGKLVIVIGSEPFNMTMMTANAGGSLGQIGGKPVVFTILSPDQPYQALEKADSYTVRFYPNGEEEPSVILECRKQASPAAIEGMPRTYIGEIVKAQTR